MYSFIYYISTRLPSIGFDTTFSWTCIWLYTCKYEISICPLSANCECFLQMSERAMSSESGLGGGGGGKYLNSISYTLPFPQAFVPPKVLERNQSWHIAQISPMLHKGQGHNWLHPCSHIKMTSGQGQRHCLAWLALAASTTNGWDFNLALAWSARRRSGCPMVPADQQKEGAQAAQCPQSCWTACTEESLFT